MSYKQIWMIVGLFLLGHALAVAQTTPKQLKEEAIAILQGITPENQRVERAITQAVEAIRESLADHGRSLFLDEVRIVSFPVGLRVFDREAQAIAILSEVAQHRDTSPSFQTTFTQVIHRLVQADEGITSTAIATAEELVKIGQGDAKNLERAKRLFVQVQRMTDPHQKVEQLKKAWAYAQRVADEKPFFLMVTAFHDSPDPFSPHLTSNTLNTTFQIRPKVDDDEDDHGDDEDDDDKGTQLFLELVEIIKISTTVVQTIKTRQPVQFFPKKLAS